MNKPLVIKVFFLILLTTNILLFSPFIFFGENYETAFDYLTYPFSIFKWEIQWWMKVFIAVIPTSFIVSAVLTVIIVVFRKLYKKNDADFEAPALTIWKYFF